MKQEIKMQAQTPPRAEDDPFDGTAAAGRASGTYAVTVDGEALELTLEQLLEAAAAGLSRRSESARMDRAAARVPAGEVYAAFLRAYPEVKPDDIPEAVWQDAQAEGSLVSAYRKWENEQLRAQLKALEKNAANRGQAVGPASGDGQPAGYDPVAEALLR